MNLKKKKMRKSALWFVCILALLCASLVSLLVAGADDAPVWTGDDLQTEYVSNQTIAVPTLNVAVGGESATAKAVVTQPDGTAVYADTVFLEQIGDYTVSYTANVGGKLYAQSKTFTVVSAIVLTGENSTAVYEYNAQYEDSGLVLSLAQGETATFANTVDIRAFTSENATATPHIELYAMPENKGKSDCRRLYITLTDAIDSAQTVTLLLRDYADSDYTVTAASVNGQQYTSWEWYTGKVFHGEDVWHAHMNSSFGANYGTNNYVQKERTIQFWYENDTKRFYYHTLDNKVLSSCKKMLIDLDDTAYYNTLFEGFSSGRVRVSMCATDYSRDVPAKFMIKNLFGIDLSKKVANFGDAPEITVDGTMFDLEDVPKAVVGGSFPVPEATATDGEGMAADVQTEVWYSAGEFSARLPVPIANGRFSTEKAGFYRIVYSASDRSGKIGTSTITVQTGESDAPTVSATVSSTATAGQMVTLPEATVTGDGVKVSVNVSVGGEAAIVQKDTDGAFFVPEQAGEFTVVYTATDAQGRSATQTYTVTVAPNATPTALQAPELPDVFIAGCRYYLPEVTAYTFDENGKKAIDTECFVTDNLGTRKIRNGYVYIPAVKNNGDTVTVAYKVGETTVYENDDVICIQAYTAYSGRNRIQIENYFIGNDMAYTKSDAAMTCTATGNNAGWTFARKLPAEGFGVTLGTIPELSDFAAIKVTLADVENETSISYTIDCDTKTYPDGYVARSGYITVQNGAEKTRIAMSTLFTGAGATVAATYNDGKWMFNRNYSLRVVFDDQGRPFRGFGDAQVYCIVSMMGGKQGAAFTVSDICGQMISANPIDGVAPVVKIFGDYGGVQTLGSTATVRKATAYDVLDPMSVLTVTVTAPDGGKVTSEDGVELSGVAPLTEYAFKLSQYGVYTVTYRAYDSLGGNMTQFTYTVTSRDDVAPVITYKSDPPQKCKKGTAFVLPDIEVTDNADDAADITVYKCVIPPRGMPSYLGEKSNSYIPKDTGVYTVVITAFDASGNASVVSFDVTVE